MELASIYHRSSDNYCYPVNQDELIINLKTGYDIEKIYIYYGDPYLTGIMGGKEAWAGEKLEITQYKRLRHHLWWSILLRPEHKRCKYYFSLLSGSEEYFFFEDGFFTGDEMNIPGKSNSYFIFPWMNISDINVTPAWVNNTIWYQIFPERFCNGDNSINPPGVRPWKYEKITRGDYYYGGDLKGIQSKLDYLHNLGINGLYLTPVFESGSIHKYDTIDYQKVDPDFGTNQDLSSLVENAHLSGMKVMLDGVFNHSGCDFKPWQDVLRHGPESIYYDWFMINRWPFDPDLNHTRKGEYYSFAYSSQMPKLNTNNPEVIQYFIDIVCGWIQEFNIDGIRLDVANEISHTFCKELRKAVHKQKKDFFLLGEIWHDAIPWLRGDELDSVMNYPLASGIQDFRLCNNNLREHFEYTINQVYTRYMEQTNNVLFNLLDSHDTNRLMDKVNGDLNIFYQYLTILFTMPGSPCIYYGTEIAMEGAHDPDCRRCMPWSDIKAGTYDENMNEIKKLIAMRRQHPSCRSKHIQFDSRISKPRVIEYTKTSHNNSLHILINCGEHNIPLASVKNIIYSRKFTDGILYPKGILIFEYYS